ncbi:NACHT domain-containing protein [Aeromonas popoffii]|uniref:NACHT domain-containing protein n=1 Tax=Aeromonas popoffii TaxID=70856 RepID=UPI000A03DCA2|nr:hypothetical protein [Aeromonas popoffii]
MTESSNNYLKSLISMREDDFTKKILKPLFEAMGYERVDFNGGPYEKGKDLIAHYRQPPRRENKITFIQSKKIGDIQNTETAAKLTQLLHQLRQCITDKILLIDGQKTKADDVLLACPEQASSRLIEEIGSQLYELKEKVRIYDGPQIIQDIIHYKPELLRSLTSIEDKLTNTCNRSLINEELLSALKTEQHNTNNSFYSDLSFFVGSIDSNILLHMEISNILEKATVDTTQWTTVKKELTEINKEYDIQITSTSIDDIEHAYNIKLNKFSSQLNIKRAEHYKKLQSIHSEIILSLHDKCESLLSMLNQPKYSDDKQRPIINDYISYLKKSISQNGDIDKFECYDLIAPNFRAEILLLQDCFSAKINLVNKLNHLDKIIIKAPQYEIPINSKCISETLDKYRQEYYSDVLKINNRSLGLSLLKIFLMKTEKTLGFISNIENKSKFLNKVITLKYSKKNDDRVSISPHDIFATGVDIAIYGGAGVGKTTTLQVYAEQQQKYTCRNIIYIPLNRVYQKIKPILDSKDGDDLLKDPDLLKDDEFFKNHDFLKNRDFLKSQLILKMILLSKDIPATEEYLVQAKDLLPSDITLILDGLDEVYTSIPEIIDAIKEFKKSFANSQIIISSRDCVSYLNDISFLGITLLPFTREQLNRFISGWLADENKYNSLIKKIDALNLYDYIKTPLIATITCALFEKGVRVPSNECAIYSERMKLLTGHYDFHKGITRQKQSSEHLIKCASTIAFVMQERNVRSLSRGEMLEILRSRLLSAFTDDLLKSCLQELIDPCNVIVIDRVTNTLSFGHFRFQEHLAAQEIKSNRGIDVIDYISTDWWRGTLGLYAQDTDFEHIFEAIYTKEGTIKHSESTLKFMINSAPENKRKHLDEFYINYKRMGEHNDYSELYSDTYDSDIDLGYPYNN